MISSGLNETVGKIGVVSNSKIFKRKIIDMFGSHLSILLKRVQSK